MRKIEKKIKQDKKSEQYIMKKIVDEKFRNKKLQNNSNK